MSDDSLVAIALRELAYQSYFITMLLVRVYQFYFTWIQVGAGLFSENLLFAGCPRNS
jgi:hypothetical protein